MTELFDDLFENVVPAPQAELQPYDSEAYKARKQQEREDTYAMLYSTSEKMQQDAALFQQYLDVQARFDRYSVNNAILILAQQPTATRLADFETWKAADIYVNKGERAVSVLEPNGTFTREDGTTATSYRVKKLFDVAQTNAESKSTPPKQWAERPLLKALISDAPCKLQISEGMSERVNAVYRPEEKTILIRAGMDAPTIFRSLAQELAHAHMDQGDYSRSAGTLPAYFASYMLCKRYNVPTDVYRFDDMPEEYKNMEPSAFRKELSKIRSVSNTISKSMSRVLESGAREHREIGGEAR